jgi:hypothetical protein
MASYFREYEAAIRDPACVVLVTDDILGMREAEHVYEALRGVCGPQSPTKRDIVGVCSRSLKPESCYIGQFRPRVSRSALPRLTQSWRWGTVRAHPTSQFSQRAT